MKKTTIAAGVAILAMSTAAVAGPGMMRGEGPATLAEAQEKSAAMFEKMDVNGDGQLDQADRDARQEQRFERLDTDGDGAISSDEFAAHHEQRGMRGDGHRGKRGHGMRMMGKMADTDNDGVITRAEFDAGVAAHFARVDTDGDGTISDAERQAAHDAMRAKWQERRAARQGS